MTLKGFDASSVQGKLDFCRLKADFVILKAQQGNDGFDSCFKANMESALAHGVEVLPYCFVYPLAHIDPKAQAKLFVDAVYAHPEMVGRPICLDLEWPSEDQWKKWGCTSEQISEYCRILCEEVERLSGRIPIIYTYPYWWKAIGNPEWASRYPLWIASYEKTPVIPAPWTDWLFWQYDGTGGEKLETGADADFDYFNGDADDLSRLIKGEAA